MKFFLDNNLSPKIAKVLDILDSSNSVIHLQEKFNRDISDIDWIRSLGQDKDWIVLTADNKILTNPHEKAAWKESGLIIFALKKSWLSLKLWDFASSIVRRWPDIIKSSQKASPAQCFIVPIKGEKIQLLK
ncbi:hypothetical protein [Leptospira neocaledonica]|uniref:VapC45 PIN like domain-containing protein n=1 Tax=Leptospira neocaledonica TaxID=2023192 RepID=A0A2N0A1C5_9LEPT|nr:hypothetical protein [Leptospira neocaledonica]PJZ78107.1 hypothetical protein CH365_06745 [Leptospira neocaledonica]